MKTFIISDTHFSHANIIRYCNRPYTNVEAMNDDMIMKWNSIISPEDRVIHNGDFSFAKDGDIDIFNNLNGRKILVKGNHDKRIMKFEWESIHDILEFTLNDKRVIMCHYPLESWNHMFHGSIHLYGHVHDKSMPIIKNRYNICVEMTDYSPVNLDYFMKEVN